MEFPLNTPPEVMCAQAQINLRRQATMFRNKEPHKHIAVIVGGAPSLKDTLPKLRWVVSRGAYVFALNGTHDWLIERGLQPDFHVICDAKQGNVAFVKNPHKGVTYLIASQCHPDVFDALEGYQVVQWVAYVDGINDVVEASDKPVLVIGGGGTVMLKTMALCALSGFRKMHLFGVDSSYHNGANHAYNQPMNAKESTVIAECGNNRFVCAPWMCKQAEDFEAQAKQFMEMGGALTVHGYGLIPWIAQQWGKNGHESGRII